MNLEFGLGRAVPEAVTTAYGARLIFPDELLQNRSALVGEGAERTALIAWLNGDRGLANALAAARGMANRWKITRDGRQTVILHKDAKGVIVACPNASCGYLYIAGWLHDGDPAKQPGAEFMAPEVRDPWEMAV